MSHVFPVFVVCIGLYGMYRFVWVCMDCIGLYMCVCVLIGMYWSILGCIDVYVCRLGCIGLYWDVLMCMCVYRVVSVYIDINWRV